MKFKVLHLYSEKTLLNKGFYVRDLSDSYLREGLHMEDFGDYKFLIIGKNYSYTLIKESEPLDDHEFPVLQSEGESGGNKESLLYHS